MYSSYPWRDKNWFTEQFIYNGKSINEMAKEFKVDWTSLERWRSIHGLPKHSQKGLIIEHFGKECSEKIDQRKRNRYSIANKAKADKLFTNKNLEEIHGEEKARLIKVKRSKSLKNIRRSEEFKENLSHQRKGTGNSNWKGGFQSQTVYKEINRQIVARYVLNMWNRFIINERGYTCEKCGLVTLKCNGHHLLSFSRIFGTICQHLDEKRRLNTMEVIMELHRFHKLHFDKLYQCLCPTCHTDIHRQENFEERINQEKKLMHLLQEYNSNPEPSLNIEEGAETIETTQIRSE